MSDIWLQAQQVAQDLWRNPEEVVSQLLEFAKTRPVELLLIVFILFVFFKRPEKKSLDNKLSPQEAQELVDEWEPEALVPALEQEILAPEPPVIQSKSGTVLTTSDGVQLRDFTTFDFMGMGVEEEVKRECIDVLDAYGCGSCGPRGFYGTVDLHLELEEKIAEFMQVPESISYSDSASTAASVIPAFAKRGDMCIVDEACNDPILTGIMLSRCKVHYFKHNDLDDLEQILDQVKQDDRKNKTGPTKQRRFVIVEAIYRNRGDIVDLKRLVDIKEKHGCRLILDESISFGVLGAHGRGLTEHSGVPLERVDILCASLCSSLGSVGGFCIGNEREVVDHQRLQGAGYCFSASAPPFVARAATVALRLMAKQPENFALILRNSNMLHRLLLSQAPHLDIISDPDSPVLHAALRGVDDDAVHRKLLVIVSEEMRAAGFYVVPSKYTRHHLMLPRGKHSSVRLPSLPSPTLRVAVSCLHTAEDIQALVSNLCEATQGLVTDGMTEDTVPPQSQSAGRDKRSRGRMRTSSRRRR